MTCKAKSRNVAKETHSKSWAGGSSNLTEEPSEYSPGTKKTSQKEKYKGYLTDLKGRFREAESVDTLISNKKGVEIVSEKNNESHKTDYTSTLEDALSGHKSFKIRYKNLWRTIDPYSISSLYIVAYCHFARDIRTFRIDRIQGVELSGNFTPDRSLLGSAKSKLMEASSYKYRHKY